MDRLTKQKLLNYRRRKLRLGLYIRQCIKHIVPLDYYKIKITEAIRIYAREICGEETNTPNVWFESKIASGFFDNVKYAFGRNKKRGVKPVSYKKFLMSAYWRDVRKKVLIRDGYKCTICGSDKLLNVHHFTYEHHFSEHEHLEDLTTLCRACHKDLHDKEKSK